MPDFTYEALDRSGQKTTGTITARDTGDAALKVRALGVFPVKIGTGKGSAAPEAKNGRNGSAAPAAPAGGLRNLATLQIGGGKRVGRVQILLFTREMADLLDAGLPMDRAFSVLIDQTDQPALQEMLKKMQGEIRAGQPLSEALSKYPREFPTLYSNMVRAGEVSGKLASVMERLADFLEKEHMRRSQVMAALTYPMVLISVALSAVVFLLTFAIPKLTPIFRDMGANLPTPTIMLLGLSSFIAKFWWAIILVIVGAILGFRSWVNTSAGRHTFDTLRLKLPLFGTLARKIVSARLVRTLGTLLGGGVPILEAMDIAASALGNVVATEALLTARGGVRQGETLHEAMGNTGAFLPVVTHMTAVGEETGRLPNMLVRTAETLDFEVDSAMRRLTSLVEPLVVLFMGVFIGFVVLSILLPIFQISSMVK
ncbi:MAG TPA: type II secretion system F family protein [Chthonomonadaceae bacterium]|nr:type II secretion system F family protein [Chthonomonadaceae bacterium]